MVEMTSKNMIMTDEAATKSASDSPSNFPLDCWILIWKKLPLTARIKAERVSSTWKRFMPYYDIRAVNLGDIEWKAHQITEFAYNDGDIQITQRTILSYWLRLVLSELLARVGPFIESISFLIPSYRLFLGPQGVTLVQEGAGGIRNLVLSNCLLRSSTVTLLPGFPSLNYLNLSSTVFIEDNSSEAVQDYGNICQQFERFIAGHENIRQLNLYNLKFSPRLQNNRLIRLQLSAVKQDDISLARLTTDSDKIVSLGLSHCRNIREFSSLVNLKQLTRLWLSYTFITDPDFLLICDQCLQLQELKIQGCFRLSQFETLKNLKQLHTLHVSDNDGFTDSVLARTARYGLLRDLLISGCAFSDEGLRFLSSMCWTTLRHLSIGNATNVEAGHLWIAQKCENLESLNVQNNVKFSDHILEEIGKNLRKLKILHMHNCPMITEEGYELLLQRRLQHIHNGVELEKLEILSRIEADNTVSDYMVHKLEKVNVILKIQRPLLALPGPAEIN